MCLHSSVGLSLETSICFEISVEVLAWSYFGNEIAHRHPCGKLKKKKNPVKETLFANELMND